MMPGLLHTGSWRFELNGGALGCITLFSLPSLATYGAGGLIVEFGVKISFDLEGDLSSLRRLRRSPGRIMGRELDQ